MVIFKVKRLLRGMLVIFLLTLILVGCKKNNNNELFIIPMAGSYQIHLRSIRILNYHLYYLNQHVKDMHLPDGIQMKTLRIVSSLLKKIVLGKYRSMRSGKNSKLMNIALFTI